MSFKILGSKNNNIRRVLLEEIGTLLSSYEKYTALNNDVSCNIDFFDGTSFVYNGERLVQINLEESNNHA